MGKKGVKEDKKEEEKQDNEESPGIDSRMYLRRSYRNLDSKKVSYIEPKVTLKEFDVQDESDESDDEDDEGSD